MTLPTCSWDRPGVNPFMGDVVAAVDRYTDIPAPVRAVLKTRMQARQYDEIAAIRRDSVTGKRKYAPEIRDMHFGQGTVCRTVTRAKWADDTVERGLVYCESDHCIIVPTVCRNVSRIKRLGTERVASAADDALPVPGGLVPRSGGGGGGGVGGGGGDSGAPQVAQNTAPGAAAGGSGGAGDASFQSVSGLPGFSVATLEIGGSAIPLLAASSGGDANASIALAASAGPGGLNLGPGLGPVAGVGSGGALVGGGGAGGGAGGSSNPDNFGPAGPLPGVGVGGGGGVGAGLDIGAQTRFPAGVAEPIMTDVPEPGAWALLLLGLVGLGVATRRR